MKTKNISKLITILTDPKTDYKAIAMNLAHHYPAMFLNCYDKIILPDKFEQELICILNQPCKDLTNWATNPKILAIKYFRTVKLCDLRIAKDEIERMIPKWREKGLIPKTII